MMKKFTTGVIIAFILGALLTGCTPKPTDIFEAIKANDLGKVEQIIKLYPEVVKIRKSKSKVIFSDWPLLYACDRPKPDPKMITVLLKTSLKEHALLAIINSFEELLNKSEFKLCDLFINDGFDINTPAPQYMFNIIDDIVMAKKMPALEYLIAHHADLNFHKGSIEAPIIDAARYDEPKVAKLLVKAGANLNVLDYKNQTALMDATFTKTGSAVIKILLDAGANINYRDDDGICAFLYAETKKQIKLFLMHGQNITVKDNKGQGILYALMNNALSYPDRQGMIYEAMMFALQKGAEVNYKVDYGWSLLKVAIKAGVPSRFIKLLRAYGAHM